VTLDEINQKYDSGEITYTEYKQLIDDFIYNESVKEKNKEVFNTLKPLSPTEVFPYLPTSNVYGAIGSAGSAILRQNLRNEMSEEEALLDVQRQLSKITRPTTVEYTDAPDIGMSRVDIEKGVAFDSKGQSRPADAIDILKAPFGRQVVGRTKESERFFDEEARRTGKREELRKQLDFIDKQLEDGTITSAEHKKRIGIARQSYEQLKGSYAGVASELLTEPAAETGQIIETPFATTLRYINFLPSAAAATAQQVMPDVNVESDTYRVADSGNFLDQVALNFAKDQGMGALYQEAYVPEFLDEYSTELTVLGSLISPLLVGTDLVSGGDKRTQAFLLGTISEVGYPVVPFGGQLVKGGKTGLRAMAKTSAENENVRRAMRLYTIAHPVESKFLKGSVNKLTSDMRGFGLEATADELLIDVLQNAEDVKPQVLKRNVREVSAEKVGNHLSTLEMVQTLDEPEDLFAFSNNITMQKLMNEVDPTASLYGDELLTELKKVAKQKSDEMTRFAEDAAKAGQTDSLALLNEAKAQARFVSEVRQTIKQGGDVEELLKLRNSQLLTDFNDELGKIQLALRAGNLLLKNTKPDLALSVNDLIISSIKNGDVSSMMQASKQSLAKKFSEKHLNFLPEDLHVVVGNMVVPTETATNKKLMEKYFSENKKLIDEILPNADGTDIEVVGDDLIKNLVSKTINYFGVDKVRQSEAIKDLILDLNNGVIKQKNYPTIIKAIQSSNAEKVLNAFAFKGGGEQFRRARIPIEAKRDLIATTREKDISNQITKGRFGNFITDFSNAWEALKYNYDTPLFIKSVEDIDSDLLIVTKEIDSKRVQLPEQFNRELLEKMESYSLDLPREQRYALAMDEIMEKISDDKVFPRIEKLVRETDRAFNGDFLARIHLFHNDQYAVQMINALGVRGKSADTLPPLDDLRASLKTALQSEADELGVPVEAHINNKMKDALIDYERFQEVVNEWGSLVKTYYGEKLLQKTKLGYDDVKDLGQSKAFKDFIVVGGSDRFNYDNAFQFLSKKSSYLDVNYTNFLQVLNSMENSIPILRGRGLKDVTLTGLQKNVVFAPTSWIIGAREGKLVQAELEAKYFFKNPQRRIDVIENFENLYTQDTYWALSAQYKQILRNIPLLQQDELQRLLIKNHIDILSKVGEGQRIELIDNIVQIMGDATNETKRASIYPELRSMKGSIVSNYMKGPLESLKAELKTILRKANVPEDIIDDVHKDLYPQISDLMVFGTWDKSRNKYLSTPTYGVIEDAMMQVRDYFEAQGIASNGRIITATIDQYPKKIADAVVKNSPYIEAVGGIGLLEDYNRLLDLGRTGKLELTMDRLRKADQGGWGIVRSALLNVFDSFRRMSSQGMLSGFPYPNMIYHAQNIVTQPIIAAMTLGFGRMSKSYNSLALSLSIAKRPKNSIALVTNSGRKYTAKELVDLTLEYNIGMTRADIELYLGNVDEILRNVDIKMTGEARQSIPVLKEIDPRYRTEFSKFADECDMSYRRAVFFEALKEDMPIDQAVDLAQKSLLDYGAMGKREKALFNRAVLFWSFTRQSMSEFLNSISKAVIDGDGNHLALIKLARMQQRQHKSAGNDFYETDQQRARLYRMFVGQSDNLPMYNYGFSNPYVEGLETIISIMETMALIPEVIQGRDRSAILDSLPLKPTYQLFFDLIRGKDIKNVPPDFIYLSKSFGKKRWLFIKRFFHIEEKDPSKRRVQEPVFGEQEVQYEFTRNGGSSFRLYQIGTLLFGIDRFLREGSRTMMTLEDPEKMKRFATTNPLYYLFGIFRSLQTVDPESAMRKHQQNLTQQLNNLEKELE